MISIGSCQLSVCAQAKPSQVSESVSAGHDQALAPEATYSYGGDK